jgi:hypothetical protein
MGNPKFGPLGFVRSRSFVLPGFATPWAVFAEHPLAMLTKAPGNARGILARSILTALEIDFIAGDEDSWAQRSGDEVGEFAVIGEFVDDKVGLLPCF